MATQQLQPGLAKELVQRVVVGVELGMEGGLPPGVLQLKGDP